MVYEFPADNKVRQAFVLENGKITANIDTTGFMTIKGTPQNDLLQNYQNKKNTFSKKAEILLKKENDSILSIEQLSDFKLEIENINKQILNNDKQFVSENANTLIGTHVFLNSFYGWNISEKEKIVALFTKETKEIERIKK